MCRNFTTQTRSAEPPLGEYTENKFTPGRGSALRGKRRLLALCFFLFLVWSITARAANPSLAPNNTPIVDPEKTGADLAARLRSTAPSKEAGFEFKRTGNLEITTRDDKTTNIPFQYLVTTTPTNWLISYAEGKGEKATETVAITHVPGHSNQYTLISGAGASKGASTANQVRDLGAADLVRPFAGSDFWVCDLGLEFLHWPQQRALRNEMRHSRPCKVLESTTPNPVPGGYARVLSWVDNDYVGILHAEAYDKSGKFVKEFIIGSTEKVNGQHELKSMKMRNLRTGQETELKFDLPK